MKGRTKMRKFFKCSLLFVGVVLTITRRMKGPRYFLDPFYTVRNRRSLNISSSSLLIFFVLV